MNAPLTGQDILGQAATARGEGKSQATVVEQSRAIAEVQGALMVADRRPRNKVKALNEAMESCRTSDVAEGAFFKFSRGGGSVAGETIHLARELARCWGNIVYAVVELDRDDHRHMSEMMTYAWDLETNARSQTQFLVPHRRDKRGGAELLTDMRDIYENNANMGARRLRECIFAVLPPYLVRSAADECRKTLENGGGEPLTVRIAQAIEAFAGLRIAADRLEAKLGPSASWSAIDVANLQISYKSIRRQEIDADEEFPVVNMLTSEKLKEQARGGAKKMDEPPSGAGKVADAKSNDGTLGLDNPTAAEGPDDSQRGESHTNSDADDMIDLIKDAPDLEAIEGLEAGYENGGRAAYETPDQDRIETAIAEAKARLKGGAK